MNENVETNIATNDEWDSIDVSDFLDDAVEADQPAAEEKTEDAPEPVEESTPVAESTPEEPTPTETIPLTHLGVTKNYTRDEANTLAQKGLDYDRVRGKYDELKAYKEQYASAINVLSEIATSQDITVDALIDKFKISQIMAATGADENSAKRQVELDKRESALKAQEAENAAKEQEKRNAKAAEDKVAEKRKADIVEFTADYPDVDPKSIPDEVWALVSKGKSLSAAYTFVRSKQLELELAAEKKNKENNAATTGSRATSGKDNTFDEIEAMWYADD